MNTDIASLQSSDQQFTSNYNDLTESVQSNSDILNGFNNTTNGTVDYGFKVIGKRIDELNTTHTQELTELKWELEKTKADLNSLKTILGAGGTQFDDAPANATAQ